MALRPLHQFRYTSEFRERFKTAFLNAAGVLFCRPKGRDQRYPPDPSYPAFNAVEAGNPDGGPNVLTWRFTIPTEDQYPEVIRKVELIDKDGTLLIEGNLSDSEPLMKVRGIPGVIFVNWHLG